MTIYISTIVKDCLIHGIKYTLMNCLSYLLILACRKFNSFIEFNGNTISLSLCFFSVRCICTYSYKIIADVIC